MKLIKDKKGVGVLNTALNAALIFGGLYLLFWVIFGAGGGIKAIYSAGKVAAAIPGWAWLVLVVFVIIAKAGGRR